MKSAQVQKTLRSAHSIHPRPERRVEGQLKHLPALPVPTPIQPHSHRADGAIWEYTGDLEGAR
eukprot:308551-Amorphochlora_amoeboformis.AAC.1